MAYGQRSIKELLELMLDNQQLFTDGLCCWAITLRWQGKINNVEQLRLHFYIKDNPPLLVYLRKIIMNGGYYWKPGDIAPRIKWINKHIKKNSK